MVPSTQPLIAIISDDPSFNYLIRRYADRIGYSISVVPNPLSVETILQPKPNAVIFPSVVNLEHSQPLVTALANSDIPIIVCSAMVDQTRTRELGADYCMLHPLVYDNFSSVLETVIQSQRENNINNNLGQGIPPINPV